MATRRASKAAEVEATTITAEVKDWVAPIAGFDRAGAIKATSEGSIGKLATKYAGEDGKVRAGAEGFNPSQVRRLMLGQVGWVERPGEFLAKALGVPFARSWAPVPEKAEAAKAPRRRRLRGRRPLRP